MFTQLRTAVKAGYPRQFWLLFVGTIISRAGSSMIWPFTMIYVSGKLELALTATAVLLTIRSITSLVATFVAGPFTDSVGRKPAMIIGVVSHALVYVGMVAANSMPAFIVVMIFGGVFDSLFRVGVDAMLIDLIPVEKRIDAYSVVRMAQNIGVATGPMIGGALIASSYELALFLAAGAMVVFGIILLFGTQETIAEKSSLRDGLDLKAMFRGYRVVFRDGQFMVSTLLIVLATVGFSIVWTLSSLYAKQELGIIEALYGLLPLTNASMVVFLQIFFTQWSKRYSYLQSMMIGCFVYAVSISSFAFAQNFWMLWLAFVVLTCGEMFFVPSATTYAANLAPESMRGRYMSLFSLHWPIASGVGPLVGGMINDTLGMRAIWWGAAFFPLAAALGYFWLHRDEKKALVRQTL
jgi:MFS family permease